MDPVRFIRRRAPLALLFLAAVGCSSGSTPTPPTTTPPTTAAPVPTPTPPTASGCPLGYGSGRFTCQGDIPGLLPQLDVAIETLVKQQPQLFDLTTQEGTGGYLVYSPEAYYAGVIANLQAQGLCGQVDAAGERISIKENNSYAEQYDILTAQSRIRRGPKTYVVTCTPANFPLTQEEAVASVAVSFFRIANCPPGTVIPPLAFNQLPVDCVGTITATPRDSIGNKLPIALHGDNISWFTRAGEGDIITVSPDPDVAFNKKLTGRRVGEWSICATVQDRTGCLNGTVIP